MSARYDDLYMADTLLVTRLSNHAHERYDHALWYAWGRDDAGDKALRRLQQHHYLGNDWAFADFAALEAERYHREDSCYLSSIADQYGRFVGFLTLLALFGGAS